VRAGDWREGRDENDWSVFVMPPSRGARDRTYQCLTSPLLLLPLFPPHRGVLLLFDMALLCRCEWTLPLLLLLLRAGEDSQITIFRLTDCADTHHASPSEAPCERRRVPRWSMVAVLTTVVVAERVCVM
jgi:hypothetical protein